MSPIYRRETIMNTETQTANNNGTEHRDISIDDHMAVIAAVQTEAYALPQELVRQPDIPVPVFLDEGLAMVVAGREHFPALEAVGLVYQQIDRMERFLLTLRSTQAVWNTERRNGRDDKTAALIEKGKRLCGKLLAAGRLALRNDAEGCRRLSLISEGDSLPDVVSDLTDFSILLTDEPEAFAAIKMDVAVQAAEAAAMRDELQQALAAEDTTRSLDMAKEMRDRVFALCKLSVTELRMFADYAFRDDKNNRRRHLFSSSYMRSRNRKKARKAAAEHKSVAA